MGDDNCLIFIRIVIFLVVFVVCGFVFGFVIEKGKGLKEYIIFFFINEIV